MANKYRGEADFKVDGDETEYHLKFTWNAAAEWETVTGAAISEALQNVAEERMSATHLRAMLWAGLRQHHPKVTILECGALIDKLGRKRANELLGVALRYYFPELKERGSDPPPTGS